LPAINLYAYIEVPNVILTPMSPAYSDMTKYQMSQRPSEGGGVIVWPHPHDPQGGVVISGAPVLRVL